LGPFSSIIPQNIEEYSMMKNFYRLLVLGLILIFALGLWGCSSATQPLPETVVVTVEKTVPVEVTRLVPVQQTVEVTRQVLVTQLVEVPVTVTEEPTATVEATLEPTAQVANTAPSQEIVYPTPIPSPTFPQEKSEGFAPLKIVNETNDILVLNINGPFQQSYDLQDKQQMIRTVKEGQYDYTVTREGTIIFRCTINITNPDKHEIHIRADKVVFLVP
jgi:hypothetical protein